MIKLHAKKHVGLSPRFNPYCSGRTAGTDSFIRINDKGGALVS